MSPSYITYKVVGFRGSNNLPRSGQLVCFIFTNMEEVFLIHLLATVFMTGLCWFVQVVHYPLFLKIDLEKFPEYEKKNFITGLITIPVMTVEMLSGLYLLYYHPEMLYFLNIILFGFIGLSTMFFQVPLHLQLREQATTGMLRTLIYTNWIRTLCWTARTAILGVLLLRYLDIGPAL